MAQAKQAAKSLQNQSSVVCTLLGQENIVEIDGINDEDAWRKARIKFVPEVR